MKIITFLFFFLFTNYCFAQNIATIDYEKIFLNSLAYKNFLKEVDLFKNNQQKSFDNIEKDLLKNKKELDSSKIILSEKEFNDKLVIYEKNVIEYQEKINEINSEIYEEIERAKSIINKEVLDIIKKLAVNQNIQLIFDANQYVVAIKELDITDLVIKQVNSNIKKIKFNK